MRPNPFLPFLCLALIASASAQTPDAAATQHKEDPHILPASDHTFTGNVAVASQYVFRGLTQTNGKPALQGGFDYAHAGGFYLGTWLSNISWYTDQNAGFASTPAALASPGAVGAPYAPGKSNSTNLEWDLYGGYKHTFASGWSLDLGLIEYYYPGIYDNRGAYRQPHTTEVYGQVGYEWASLKYSKAVSTDTFGFHESKGADYVDLSAGIPMGESGCKILAHAGRQTYPRHRNEGYWGNSGGDNGFFTYTDYKIGLMKEGKAFTFSLAWTYADTKDAAPDGETTAYLNAFGKNIGGNRITLTVMRVF